MKLKKLIMCGFKSFADRTEFIFDDGVSCIVGPNGCGKSNVVDGMKWVLGEQSAKSLRGSEMMDVIFNGSSARRAAGMAEVSLVFENSDGMLQVPGSEDDSTSDTVSVTRRLYRSGQSEYLINKSPARLKDIREMFMDTGIGRDAYSVIEQGRVEAFLQASQEDRRSIFDEAAGISKYKARKKEALRKLERVEQNLLRVNDVLAEIEKRLRSIKYQAGKARNYQTYSERLKELRSLYFLSQYHMFSRMRRELQNQLDTGNDSLSGVHARINQLESAHSGTEVEAVDLERTARELQGQIASIDAQITACQERADLLTTKVEELGEQIVAITARNEELEAKTASCREEISAKEQQYGQITAQSQQLQEQYQNISEEHTEGDMRLAHVRAALEEEKAAAIDLMRQSSSLSNEVNSGRIRQENLESQRQRLIARSEEISGELENLVPQQRDFTGRIGEVQTRLGDSQARLDNAVEQIHKLADDEQSLRGELAQAREKRSAVHSRTAALEEMQSRHEGVSAGVRKILQARSEGKLDFIKGMFGDFLKTDIEHAPIVEAALAGADQRLVVESLDELNRSRPQIDEILAGKGTVEFICLDSCKCFSNDIEAAKIPAVIGRVIDYVTAEAAVAPVLWGILGKTVVVEDIQAAGAAMRLVPDGVRFVTISGDLLEADRRVRIGAANQGAGVITRRSELAQLQRQSEQLDTQIEKLQSQCVSTRHEIQQLEQTQKELRAVIYEANTTRVECESKLRQLHEQIENLRSQQPIVNEDLAQLALEIDAVLEARKLSEEKLSALQDQAIAREQAAEEMQQQIASSQARQNELSASLTETKVEMASAQQKQIALRDGITSLKRQNEQMLADYEAGLREIELNRQRRSDAEAGIVKARQEVDTLYEKQQRLNSESQEVEETRAGLQGRLNEIRAQLSQQRKQLEQATEEINKQRVKLGQVDANIENIISRSRDEMDMDLVAMFREYEHDEQRDWDAVKLEISDLQEKIKRLGNVNLDAISEQEELEEREKFLSSQLKDITDSRNKLTDLINRINRESHAMFTETFEKVREHFQNLFRKLFGGGRADILLTDPEDVLESGIEIVARPPGKELRSLSLMSGGEKTMTALSLLFSIFKAKPSPFCLLDEVDAALDEANTERFGNLFSEFVGTSQFIVISHAKRTMSMANVLYGVTMQEPGVSKRISVRFEDSEEKLDKNFEHQTAAV